MEAVAHLAGSDAVVKRPANRWAIVVEALRSTATAAAHRRCVAFSAERRDLSGGVLIYERPHLPDAFLGLVRHRILMIVPGTIDQILLKAGVDHQPDPLQLMFGANGLTIFFGRRGGRDVVSRVALSRDMEPVIVRLAARSRFAREAAGDLAPEVLEVNRDRVIETRLTGSVPTFSQLSEKALQTYIISAIEPLTHLARGAVAGDPDSHLMRSLPRFVAGHSRGEELASLLSVVVNWDRSRVKAGTVHGDYWLKNLLFANGQVRGIIDWDMCRTSGCIGLDALHLGFMSYAAWSGREVSELLSSLWTGIWPFPWLAEYCKLVGTVFELAPGDVQPMTALLWLWYVFSKHNPAPAWEGRMIDPIVPAFH